MNGKNNSKEQNPVWRESASLIICAKNLDGTNGYDYELLMIKRSDRTAIIQNQCVFPGGIYDPFDESIEWLKYFDEFGVNQQSLKEFVLVDNNTERPKILAPQGTGCYDRFFKSSKIWAREISLRINAIRETFEEVGILLCRTKDQLHVSGAEGLADIQFDKKHWQKAVHDDPRNFLLLCRELKVVPDLWGLQEWCCWASPAVIQKGFETAFFITFLNEKPKVYCEESEVKEYFWLPPTTLLEMCRNFEIFFLPPQFYEISRFIPYKSYSFLKSFAKERSGKGVTMCHPIAYSCTDGLVSVLPGDDFYAGCPRQSTVYRNVDFTLEEFRAHSKCIHRMENLGQPDAVIHLNFEPLDGHLKPHCGYAGKHKL